MQRRSNSLSSTASEDTDRSSAASSQDMGVDDLNDEEFREDDSVIVPTPSNALGEVLLSTPAQQASKA